MAEKYCCIFVTVPTEEMAVSISQTLVREKLAACVQISGPVRSIYQWQNKVCDEKELVLVIKSTLDLFEEIKNCVVQLHTYDVPEIIALPISQGLDKYLNWIEDVTR